MTLDDVATWLSQLGEAPGESQLGVALTGGPEHRIRFANAAFLHLCAPDQATLEGVPLAQVLRPSRPQEAQALLDETLRTRTPRVLTRLPPSGGAGPPAAASRTFTLLPLALAGGHAAALQVQVLGSPSAHLPSAAAVPREELREANQRLVLAAVREQELAEEARASAMRWSTLLEGLTEGVIVSDASGAALMVNPVARRLLGLEEDAPPLARLSLELRRPDGTLLPAAQHPFERARRGEAFAHEELVLRQPDGTSRWLLFSGSAMHSERGGEVLAGITLFMDVTELRRLEQLRAEYVALVSHDLVTPMAALRLTAEELAGRLSELRLPREARSAQRLLKGVDRVHAMVRDLRESMWLESGHPELSLEPVDLVRLVTDLLATLVAPASRARLSFRHPSPVPRVRVDAARTARAIMNLIDNALRYSPPDTPVSVILEAAGDTVVLSVADRGPGIPPPEQPFLFDKYFRASSGRKVEGTGLGLYLTRLVAEAHGGRVWVETAPGRGSTFFLAVPVGAPPSGETTR